MPSGNPVRGVPGKPARHHHQLGETGMADKARKNSSGRGPRRPTSTELLVLLLVMLYGGHLGHHVSW
jgi:hypothetical protein